MRVIVLWWN